MGQDDYGRCFKDRQMWSYVSKLLLKIFKNLQRAMVIGRKEIGFEKVIKQKNSIYAAVRFLSLFGFHDEQGLDKKAILWKIRRTSSYSHHVTRVTYSGA